MPSRCLAALVLAAAGLQLALACAPAADQPLTIPDSPDGTIEVVCRGLADDRPEVVWNALPPSYQADVRDLAVTFAENVDPALFDRAVAVARKGTLVLQRKKDLVLASEAVRNSGADPESLDAVWEGVMHIADAVLASDLARLDAYRDLDVEAVLATTGREVMGHLAGISYPEIDGQALADWIDNLDSAEVEPVGRDGDTAMVRVTRPDGVPVDLEMIRVEGRWLPIDLVERWPDAVVRARTRLDRLGRDEGQRTKMQVWIALGVAERFIDQIDELESPEDFDTQFGGFLGSFVPIPSGTQRG